ncbi:MAG: alkylphosphonate utilization protein [Chitinophagaceae bacterium]|nr:alkylphosphonate utilization protein [Oligoflexus sp.]
MTNQTKCPKCGSEHIYEDRGLWVCPECAHEWTGGSGAVETSDAPTGPLVVKDAHGNVLQDGDSVTVIKDLKVKGSSTVVKVGTKVKGIRLIDSDDGHNIGCKIEGFGQMNLKSEFIKKS